MQATRSLASNRPAQPAGPRSAKSAISIRRHLIVRCRTDRRRAASGPGHERGGELPMGFAPPFVSAFTAGLIIVMQMLLLLGVVRARLRVRQSIGDGGNQELLLAIRRHGNFTEN